MSDYEPVELNAYYRAGHSTLWELADKTGILGQLGITLKSLEFCDSSSKAEAGLFSGAIDFVAGNHITPYLWVARGKPIVALASPSNTTRDAIVSRRPIDSVADLKGLRLADTGLINETSGYAHIRGNHNLELLRGGVELDEVEWVEVPGGGGRPEDRGAQIDALRSDRADAALVMAGGAEELAREGFHILELDTLPMVNGPTITTSIETLHKKDRLGERLVRAMVLTIHFARTQPDEANRLLGPATAGARMYTGRGGRAGSMARLPMKPYPDPDAVANAYRLCCMQYPETQSTSPYALWDTHYLRELDLSGFIDELIEEQPKTS